MTRIHWLHTYASLAHYARHIGPVWRELPDNVVGETWAPHANAGWGTRLPGRTAERAAGPLLLASYADVQKLRDREYIYLEHGAGQSYHGDPAGARSGSYSGDPGHDRAIAFLCPNETVAERWRAAYPDRPAYVVGCPWLDYWHRQLPEEHHHEGSDKRVHAGRYTRAPVIAFTFHWECQLVPETRSALEHYRRSLGPTIRALRAAGAIVWGHGHPRAWGELERLWGRLSVPRVPHLDDVFNGADLLVGDNTSALYEFASLGKPVVCLNAPWYRRDVEHGLRFWSHVPGTQVDDPATLEASIWEAFEDPNHAKEMRARAVAAAYAHTDGRAAERAAAAIVEVLDAQPVRAPAPARVARGRVAR